jgi:hypothetical protein
VGRLAISGGPEPLDHHREIGRIEEVEVFRSLGDHDRCLLHAYGQGMCMDRVSAKWFRLVIRYLSMQRESQA